MRRVLVAILSADVVGYSRLTGQDPEGMVQHLHALRAIIAAAVAVQSGRVFGVAGGGCRRLAPRVVDHTPFPPYSPPASPQTVRRVLGAGWKSPPAVMARKTALARERPSGFCPKGSADSV